MRVIGIFADPECALCKGTGVWETGNNDLPCRCLTDEARLLAEIGRLRARVAELEASGARWVARCGAVGCGACVDVDLQLDGARAAADVVDELNVLAVTSLAGALGWWTGPHGGGSAEAVAALGTAGEPRAGLVERLKETKFFCPRCWSAL